MVIRSFGPLMMAFLLCSVRRIFGIFEADIGAHVIRKRDAVDEVPGFFRLLEWVVGAEHDRSWPSAAMVQFSGSAEHMPDVVTMMFSLMYCDGGFASLTA